MLVLTRKIGEEIVIGDGIRIRVVAIKGSQIRLGFEAPDDVVILRTEMADPRGQLPALEGLPRSSPAALGKRERGCS